MPINAKHVAIACGALVLATPALGQRPPGPPPPPPGTPIMATLDYAGGKGAFTGVINAERTQICYILNVGGIGAATGAQVHTGAVGENGEAVLQLETPQNGSSGGCADISGDLAQALLANPGGYYVAVQNADFPDGALRGQLNGHAANGPPA